VCACVSVCLYATRWESKISKIQTISECLPDLMDLSSGACNLYEYVYLNKYVDVDLDVGLLVNYLVVQELLFVFTNC